MGVFSAFPFLGAVEVVARSQLCLILKGLCSTGEKRHAHNWLSYGTEWNKSVNKREIWKDVEKQLWWILLRSGLGRLLGAGHINPGPEGFENIVSDSADKKIPRNI